MAEQGKGPEAPGKDRPPKWRFAFFATIMVLVLVGGQFLGIPREISLPVLIGCLIALANGALPTWFGRDK